MIGAPSGLQGPVVLLVLDGLGFNPREDGNAVAAAGHAGNTPNLTKLIEDHGCVLVRNDGESVGLRPGQFGNSDVGHKILRGIMEVEALVNIDRAIEDGSFFRDEAIVGAVDNCLKKGSALHITGLCSDIGVHGDINHMYEILRYAKERGVEEAFVHFIADGRDSAVRGSISYNIDTESRGHTCPKIIKEVIGDIFKNRDDLEALISGDDGYSRLVSAFIESLKEKGYAKEDGKPIMGEQEIGRLVDAGDLEIPGYLLQAEAEMSKIGLGKIATVGGRQFYMDRNQRWDRVEQAYLAMTHTGAVN